jgi:hypothetical protein
MIARPSADEGEVLVIWELSDYSDYKECLDRGARIA